MRHARPLFNANIGFVPLAAFVCVLAFALRAWLARDTSFWGDEFSWMSYGAAPTALDSIRAISKDPSPHLFMDVVFLNVFSRLGLALGLDPHVAVRLHSILFSTGIMLLPLAARSLARREKLAWLAATALNVFLLSTAANSKPYASLAFFSTALVLAACEAASEPRLGERFWIFLGIGAFGTSFSVYLALPIAIVCAYAAFEHYRRRGQRGERRGSRHAAQTRLLALLVGVGAFYAWWLFLYRVPLETPSRPLGQTLVELARAPWLGWARETFGSFSNPPKRVFLVAPIVAIGLWVAVRRNVWLAAALAAILGASIVFPAFTDVKHGYFYVPRQALPGLPVWILLFCFGLLALADRARGVRGAPFVVYALALVALGVLPSLRALRAQAPFVDQPLRKYHRILPGITRDRGILVLNGCEADGVRLYESGENFASYFEQYRTRPPLYPKSARVRLWADTVESCGGLYSETATDPKLQEQVRAEPTRFVLIAPFEAATNGAVVPRALRRVPCVTETNQPCAANPRL